MPNANSVLTDVVCDTIVIRAEVALNSYGAAPLAAAEMAGATSVLSHVSMVTDRADRRPARACARARERPRLRDRVARRLVVTTRETDESYREGQGVPPFDAVKEITLTPDGDQTVLVLEVRGMPLDAIAFFGAGWQIHAENLAAYLAGREPEDVESRWQGLVPPYQDLAADLS
jgi:hypothetical protein